MKASELRVENIVKFGNDIVKIEIISKSGEVSLQGVNSFYPLSITDIKPIPLTEELLLKCGFKSGTDDGINYWFTNNGIVINKSDWDGIFKLELNSIQIDYIHQLQNIIHALTNNELNIDINNLK